MVTKNWTSKVGLSRFSNNAHELFCSQTVRFPRKTFQHSRKKMHFAILSKVD
jgi:hypothetical protein